MKLFKRIQSIMGKKTLSKQFQPLNQEVLAALDEDGLYTALSSWFFHQEKRKTDEAFWKEMNENARIVYTAQRFEIEVNNGGIQQYFENNSGKTAPFLSTALNVLHAEQYLKLWKVFLEQTGMDSVTLSNIASGKAQDRLDAMSEEVLEEFDESFNKLESEETLEKRIIEYARGHIEEIFGIGH